MLLKWWVFSLVFKATLIKCNAPIHNRYTTLWMSISVLLFWPPLCVHTRRNNPQAWGHRSIDVCRLELHKTPLGCCTAPFGDHFPAHKRKTSKTCKVQPSYGNETKKQPRTEIPARLVLCNTGTSGWLVRRWVVNSFGWWWWWLTFPLSTHTPPPSLD